jgi:hypothetical protein
VGTLCREDLQVPFRKYQESFSPEVLDAMTTAYDAAIEAAPNQLSDANKQYIAERILHAVSEGIFAPSELTNLARQYVARLLAV